MNKEQEGFPRFLSHPIRSPPGNPSLPLLTEADYHDGLVPGVIYATNGGSIERYVPRKCWSHGGSCSSSCDLFSTDGCQLSRLNKGKDIYRSIDNEIMYPKGSTVQHPGHEQSPERETLVDKEDRSDSLLHPNTLEHSPLPTIKWEVKDIEETIDEM